MDFVEDLQDLRAVLTFLWSDDRHWVGEKRCSRDKGAAPQKHAIDGLVTGSVQGENNSGQHGQRDYE
jgi:hypothetical protein